MSREKIYKYPEPEKIQINESDLKLKLKEYYDTVTKKVSFIDLFIMIPAWIPIFTSEFKEVFGFPGSTILGFYTAIVILGTLWFIATRSDFYGFYKRYIKKDEIWLKMNETNPYKKATNIKSECK